MQFWRVTMLTVIAVGVAYALAGGFVGDAPGDYGLDASAFTSRDFAIRSVPPGSSLFDAGIRPGEHARWSTWDFKTRSALLGPMAGTSIVLRTEDGRRVTLIAHAGKKRGLPLTIVAVKLAFLLVAALLALRRWEERAVRSLVVFLFALGFALGLPNANPIVSPALSYIVFVYGSMALIIIAGASAADFSAHFSTSTGNLERAFARGAIVSAALALLTSLPLQFIVLERAWIGYAVSLLVAAPYAFALATFVSGYVSARGPDRARRLWIVLIIGVGIVGPTVDILTTAVVGYVAAVDQFALLTCAIIPVGLAYVILRHRLIDVGFVLNQAAIYAGVSVVVAAVVVIVETVLSQYVNRINNSTSTTVQLAVAVALGFSINAIHKRVERIVDRLFFHERHEAQATLSAFAQSAAYNTNVASLLERCIQTVERYMHCDHAGIWMRDESGAYAMQSGDFSSGLRVEPNDPAIVALQKRHGAVDLEGIDSKLPGLLAFPMISGGELLGLLVCDAKTNGETYAPDDREVLERAAYAVGHAWQAVRLRELERQISERARIAPRSPSVYPKTL